MGMLPLPKVEAPPVAQLAVTSPPPVADTPLTMREFAMIMMQQGNNGTGNTMRPNYQNLHEDPYNEDEPMEDRYANLRPSSRIEEIDETVLRDYGATDEQINNYKEQIQQQQKASVRTTNEQKLEAAGIDPEIVQTVTKIATIKTAGTWQGKRNIKPYGDYINNPHFRASYNAARALWLNQQPSERKNAKNRTNKYSFLEEDEDPWNDNGIDNLSSEEMRKAKIKEQVDKENAEDQARNEMNDPPATIINNAVRGHLARKKSKDMKDMKDMENLRLNLIRAGLRKDPEIERKIEADLKKVMQESNSAKLLSRALKGHNARKEARELQEEKLLIEKQKAEEQAGKVISKAAQRYQATKKKKAEQKRIKETLEAEIAALQEEMKAGSRQQKEPKSSEKSKRINKALGSIKDFWLADTTQEAARQDRRDAREAKKDAQKKTEDNLTAKAKALQDKRKQLELLGSAAN
jgi:hypothetical protein